jgi:ABC-type branched-subunit amino acid transport system substrate-binding protein
VELISYDDEANPATSLAAMTKLATTDNANAVIGSIMSSCMIGQLDTLTQYKLPTFTGGMSPTLTNKGCKYVFRSTINQDYVLTDIMNALKLIASRRSACSPIRTSPSWSRATPSSRPAKSGASRSAA